MAARIPFDVTRHCVQLPEKEVEVVVGILADLIVAYLKSRSGQASRGSAAIPDRDSEGRM